MIEYDRDRERSSDVREKIACMVRAWLGLSAHPACPVYIVKSVKEEER